MCVRFITSSRNQTDAHREFPTFRRVCPEVRYGPKRRRERNPKEADREIRKHNVREESRIRRSKAIYLGGKRKKEREPLKKTGTFIPGILETNYLDKPMGTIHRGSVKNKGTRSLDSAAAPGGISLFFYFTEL